MSDALTVLVLGGGPDREREVSLKSAAAVAHALRQAGHRVLEADVGPDNTSALDRECDVVFPVLHGAFGEGGPLQHMLEERGLRYVGCGPRAAEMAMDKCLSKEAALRVGVPTPVYQKLGPATVLELVPPLVIKPLTEGSSFGVHICQEMAQVQEALRSMAAANAIWLAEKFIVGAELTLGIVDGQVLPAIRIVPAEGFYDHQAKYFRSDTKYIFETGLPQATLKDLDRMALAVFQALECRHLSRVDFMVDRENRPWFLEINTMPGFTDHSLLPMAAAKAGITMPALCDRLVRLALRRP